MLLGMLAIAACKPRQDISPVQEAPATEMVARTSGGKDSVQGEYRMTVLNQLLALFATENGAQWQSYDGVAGIVWSDAQPVETPEVVDPNVRYSRSGKLTLSGFGETDLPDGNVGADAGVRRGNEGESGVTLNGDMQRVTEVAVVKFYPSEDYETILKRQFATNAALLPEADSCALDFGTKAENTQRNKFYRIQLDGTTRLHIEAFVDEDAGPSGPGSTTFVFYRAKPEQRIAAMQCHEV